MDHGGDRDDGGGRDLLIAAGLAVGPLVGVGLARFAYALLLPAMREDLGWSYTQAGVLNTANAAGYLAGALAAAPVIVRAGAGRAFLGGLVGTALALLASALTGNLAVLVGLRTLAGATGAVTFVAALGLSARMGAGRPAGRAALLLGMCVAGGGIGILLSGLGIPALLAALGPHLGWRAGWLLLGTMALLTVPAAVAARRRVASAPARAGGGGRWPRRRLAAAVSSYGLYGVGYIAYMTFIVALLRERGTGDGGIAVFWSLLGLAAVGASFAWGPLLSRARGGRGMALLLALLAVGAALPVVTTGSVAAYGSAVLVGATFLPVVTAVTIIARRVLDPRWWDAAIAGLTVAFAVGQCAGPVLAGALSDRSGGVRGGLLLSAVLLAVAAVLALLQRDDLRAPAAGVTAAAPPARPSRRPPSS